MKSRRISISSDSCSDDDVPLKMIKMNGHADPNSYDSLCQHSKEECEFCERIFENRYSSLIHNVSHIIIPLLNQNVIQCKICLHHFTSEKDLSMHKLRKHPILSSIPKILVKNETVEFNINDIINREVEHRLNMNSLQNQDPNLNNIVRQDETNKDEQKIESIKNRLVFEDDVIILDSDQLLSDLTTDCKVNLENFGAPCLNLDDFSGKSVHYDVLVKPGVFRCKKCVRLFPTRYDAIIHESSHITLKDSQVTFCMICRNFILGDRNNLRLHYMKIHKPYPDDYVPMRKKIVFDEDKIENTEDRRTFDSKTMFLCKLCFTFCKNMSSKNYEFIKNVSEIGKRFNCEKCNSQFFDIKLVRRHIQRRLHCNNMIKKKKHTTKEERLKNIKKRFKMMKH